MATKNKPKSKIIIKNNKKSETPDDLLKKRYILLGIFGAPVVGWLIGAMLNPSGWMSDPLGLAIGILSVLLFWPISVPVVIAIIVLAVKKQFEIMRILMLISSIVSAIVVMMLTASAEEDEFA